ncbi:hypothetical protein H5410_023347 [Solanum commersonii]|uniref:Uncharacterized protein n=1 Tax=Solanum commersonii TaxID=4109 RepID=A0A9J5ZHA7_SOLCO|nr:hypothetical protein H5410_023347 [Solanum commersonii]
MFAKPKIYSLVRPNEDNDILKKIKQRYFFNRSEAYGRAYNTRDSQVQGREIGRKIASSVQGGFLLYTQIFCSRARRIEG